MNALQDPENTDNDESDECNEINNIGDIVDVITQESNLKTQDEVRVYLVGLYDQLTPMKFNNETMSTIGTIVRNKIVRNVKFIEHEHTSGLSREGICRARSYPSFWKPDLTIQHSIQSDIFNEFPDMADATLQYKAQAWIGMRDKVLNAIRSHCNTVQTAIQMSIVDGK